MLRQNPTSSKRGEKLVDCSWKPGSAAPRLGPRPARAPRQPHLGRCAHLRGSNPRAGKGPASSAVPTVLTPSCNRGRNSFLRPLASATGSLSPASAAPRHLSSLLPEKRGWGGGAKGDQKSSSGTPFGGKPKRPLKLKATPCFCWAGNGVRVWFHLGSKVPTLGGSVQQKQPILCLSFEKYFLCSAR